MAITVTQIQSLVGRYTNSIVTEQANLECPFVGDGIIKKKKVSDKVGVVNIKAGEVQSGGMVADGGTLPDGGDVQPVQGTYLPVAIFARLSIPRIAAKLATSLQDGINLVKEEMESCGATLGRILGRALFVPNLGSPALAVSAGDTSFTIASPAGIREGMWLEVWNPVGPTLVEGAAATPIRVVSVTPTLDGSPATVTFTASGAGSGAAFAWTTAYQFYIRGSRVNAMASLSDVTASSSLYGLSNTSNAWSGNLDSSTTTLSVTALRRMITLISRRRGRKPTHILSNSVNAQRYSDLLINNRRFAPGQKMDAVGSSAFELEGVPWVVDENIDDTDVYFFNDKDVKLHEFQDFQPEVDGDKSPGMNMAATIVSATQLIYDVQVLGIYNLRCERRNGTGRFTGFTA